MIPATGSTPIFQTLVPLATSPSIHSAVLPTALSLSSSLLRLPKPSVTQHTKLQDKQRQGHTERRGEQFLTATQQGGHRQRRGSRAVPLSGGRGNNGKATPGEEEQTERAHEPSPPGLQRGHRRGGQAPGGGPSSSQL